MISNKTKRNIFLALFILGLLTIVTRTIDMFDGGDWKNLAGAVVITGLTFKAYLNYRRAVREGNLHGPVPFTTRKSR